MKIKSLSVVELARELEQIVDEGVFQGQALHTVERQLWSRLLAMGQRLVDRYLTRLGPGDEGAEVVRGDRRLKRCSGLRCCRYWSIYGEVAVDRPVYARGEQQRVEYAPLDQSACGAAGIEVFLPAPGLGTTSGHGVGLWAGADAAPALARLGGVGRGVGGDEPSGGGDGGAVVGRAERTPLA